MCEDKHIRKNNLRFPITFRKETKWYFAVFCIFFGSKSF